MNKRVEKIKAKITKKHASKNRLSLKPLFASAVIGVIFAGLFSTSVYVFATPPDSKYTLGETLDPSCVVGSTNCTVLAPVPYTGATDDLNLGSKAFTTTGASTLGTVSTTSTSGAQVTTKYNSTNYATLTTASNGDLTIATVSATTGGNIKLSSAITGDFTLLSDSGTLVLGGTGNTNNEDLKFDFETSSNKVAVTSSTGATDIDFGSINLISTGIITLGGSTTGTLVTRVKTGAASESDANGSLVIDSTNGRLYIRYGSAWHYIAQTAGFQIPDFETIDPISGEQIKEGDIVLGMVNQTFEDKALHGVWVKWDSVKDKLLADIQANGGISPNGGLGNGLAGAGTSAGIETFLQKVTNTLFSLGITVKNGITSIKQLRTERSDTDVARIKKIELVDSETGELYCTWIKNGQWQKAQGECGSVQVAVADTNLEQEASEAVKQAANQAASQAAAQAAEQAGQQALEEVKENIKNEIENRVDQKVQEEVKEEVKEQLEKEPKESGKSDSVKKDLPGDNLLEILVPQNVPPENPQEPVVSEPSVSEPVVSEPSVSEPDTSEPVASEPVESEPIPDEPTVTEPVEDEPAASEEAPIVEPTQEEPAEPAPVEESASIQDAAAALADKAGGVLQMAFDQSIHGFENIESTIIAGTGTLARLNEKISKKVISFIFDMNTATDNAATMVLQFNNQIPSKVVWSMLDMGAMTSSGIQKTLLLNEKISEKIAWSMLDMGAMTSRGVQSYLQTTEKLNLELAAAGQTLGMAAQVPVILVKDIGEILGQTITSTMNAIGNVVSADIFEDNNQRVASLAQKSVAGILKANFYAWEMVVNEILYVQGKMQTSAAGLIEPLKSFSSKMYNPFR